MEGMDKYSNLLWKAAVGALLLFMTGCSIGSENVQTASPEMLVPVTSLETTPTKVPATQTRKIIPTIQSQWTETQKIVTASKITSTNTNSPTSTPTQNQPVTLLFTGVIVPARCIHESLINLNDFSYPYAEILDLLQTPDLAIGTLNASLSVSTPKTFCEQTLHLIADPANAPALKDAGFDIINLATNHIKNCRQSGCGDTAFLETLDAVRGAGLLSVGADLNLELAYQPLYVELGGTTFAFVSMGHIEPASFAGENTPGIAVMTEASIAEWIGKAKANADVVIFMPHWGPEDSPRPTHIQRKYAQAAVGAGADLVVGNHTHVIQGYEQIEGVWVFYGLGNFLFDQTFALDHQQSVLLSVTFQKGEFSGFELIPLHVDDDGRIYQPDEMEAEQILEDMLNVSLE